MFSRAIWDKQPSLVFKNIKKLPSLRSGNFIMFLKTNLGYLSQIAVENMQLLILIDNGLCLLVVNKLIEESIIF